MSYFNDFYTIPFRNMLKKWKIFIYTTIIEFIFIGLLWVLGNFLMKTLDSFLLKISDIEMKNGSTFLNNVPSYNVELATFYLSFIIAILVFLVIFFVLYSISRTIIWNWIAKLKNNFMRNMFVDGLLYIIFVLMVYFGIFYVKEQFYAHYIIIIVAPLLYYSFFCHMNYQLKGFNAVMKKSFSRRMLFIMPHLLFTSMITLLLLLFLPLGYIRIVVLVLIFNLFRLYAYEILKVNKYL